MRFAKRLGMLLSGLVVVWMAGDALAIDKAASRAEACATRDTPAERMICGDRQLTRLDAELNELYAMLRGSMTAADFRYLRDDQRDWLNVRNRCGANFDCLAGEYDNRIVFLQQQVEAVRDSRAAEQDNAGMNAGHRAVCDGEGEVRSLNGDIATTIAFMNRADSEEDSYKIYWLDYQGNRKLYATIYKGQTHEQATFLSHPWVVTSPVPGGGEICLGIYMPDPGWREVILR